MKRALRRLLILTTISAAIGVCDAAPTIVSGSLGDRTNAALMSSDGYDDLGAAQFGTDADVARNVAIYRLAVLDDGSVIQFTSKGYGDGAGQADGGAQPYFSLFSGSDATATFVDSSYFDPNIDFQVSETLAAGTYLFTIGLFENLSFAENEGLPGGSLSEGFTALGDPTLLGNAFYRVDVSSDAADFAVAAFASTAPGGPSGVPEPGVAALLAIGLSASIARRRRSAPPSN